ncbi:MAG TPA: LytTR family DNA-binding domain-containing protein [Bacteroidaceae bacterium]|nr:LytTR family DNA-binding domain-containing protein [Bacteroidaceae bacterium]
MIRCIAIDDEPLALNNLENYIKKTPALEFIDSFINPTEALGLLLKEKVDLMFIDINMPDINGLDFVKSLSDTPMVVFTTAHSEYAVEGFRVDAVDYLLKPFGYKEFLRSVGKALKLNQFSNSKKQKSLDRNDEYIYIKAEYKVIKIRLKDIIYIESMSEYVKIYVHDLSKPLITLLSLKNIEDSLPKDRFMRVHRSYIVNLLKIKEVQRMRIVFPNSVFIPIGESYKDLFFSYIENNYLGKE